MTFEEWSKKYDSSNKNTPCHICKESWQAAEKATERRVLDHVKQLLKERRCRCGYNGNLWDAFYNLRDQYGIKE